MTLDFVLGNMFVSKASGCLKEAAMKARVAQEPNQNQKPEPKEPFFQEPEAEPEQLNRGGSKPGGFPLFLGKVQSVSRTLSGLFLVGALLNRPTKRKGTNRGKSPDHPGANRDKSRKNRDSPKKDKKKGQKGKDKSRSGSPPPPFAAQPEPSEPFLRAAALQKCGSEIFSVFLCQRCRGIWREIWVKFSVLCFPGCGCATENFTKTSRQKRCEKRKISLACQVLQSLTADFFSIFRAQTLTPKIDNACISEKPWPVPARAAFVPR